MDYIYTFFFVPKEIYNNNFISFFHFSAKIYLNENLFDKILILYFEKSKEKKLNIL